LLEIEFYLNNRCMKNSAYLVGSLSLLLVLISTSSIAQKRLSCGTEKVDTAFLLRMASLEQSPNYRMASTTRMIKVFIHILFNDIGSGQAITRAQVETEFQTLLADFSSNNLCFYLAGVDTIRNNDLNEFFNVDEDDPNEFDPYQVPGCLNIFYVRRIQGENTSCSPPCGIGGIALGGVPGTFCLVDDGNIGGHTISHEVGHCLGLSHTFSRINGRECINGSNSFQAGDLVWDTRADPFSFDGASCYSEQQAANNCITYTGDCEDPCGSTAYNPPYDNLMSYWPGCITQNFTPGQFTRINSTIDNNLMISALASPETYTQNAITRSSGFFVRAAIEQLTTNGSVNIRSGTVASFGGSSVVLKAGFLATPTGIGSTSVKVHGCN
jgi:Pregnancy-associated plasma protein-A